MTTEPDDPISRLERQVRDRLLALPGHDRRGYVGSDLPSVDRVIARIQNEGLASGPVFCEWGSGLGGVCGVAALHGLESHGIEIQEELVHEARGIAEDLALPMVFAAGTFLLPGDEDLAASTVHTRADLGAQAWDELGLAPADCDVVFAYPWPGEESLMDDLFERHASDGALLITFHDHDRVLVQRKTAGAAELQPLGWM